ncbi:MAG: prenyltransferase/squalene oxidase repeat-containing protein [Thermoleophilaceae bacterium]
MTWQLASFLILGLVIAVGFGWYERSHPSARVLALVAALAAFAVVGRLAFAAIPNVKPTTDIVLLAGHALGAVPGFAVGAVTAIVSNLFFSQGPWTPWQMVAWGGVGAAGGGLAWALHGRELGRWALAAVCGLAGLAFGAFMDVYQWTFAAEQTLSSYLAISATSLPFNLAHAIGNVAFCLAFGPAFVRAVARYRRRFEVRWRLPSPAAASVVAALAVAALVVAPAAQAASATSRGLGYLDRAQNADGGFGGARAQGSTQLHTGWAALGIAAAGRNPRDVTRRGRSVMDFIRRGVRELNDTGELERTILAVRAAGLNPRRFGRRDLVRLLLRRRDRDGSWEGRVNHTAFGMLALSAGGESRSRLRGSARWLERAQSEDGGFGVTPGGASDVDDTGAVLQALAAAGRGGSPAARRAISYLRGAQNPDGGFGQTVSRDSNAQSTAWAMQGLIAVGRSPARLRRGGRTPAEYLRSLQARDGSVRYSRTSAQTPVWVTAQALTALARKAFPLRPVKRRARRSADTPAGAPAPGGSDAAAPPAKGDSSQAKPRSEEEATEKLESPPVQSVPRRPGPDSEAEAPSPPVAGAAADNGGDEEGGPSGALVGGALAAVAALVLALRRWWRRRHCPGSPADASA